VKCVDCGKGIRHSQKGYTWREEQRCPQCYMQYHNLKKVKINQPSRVFEFVYVNSEL